MLRRLACKVEKGLQVGVQDRLITSPCSRRRAPAALLSVAVSRGVLSGANIRAGGRRAAAEGARWADKGKGAHDFI